MPIVPMDRKLMCGVLVSTKSLAGERNRWWKRYPEPATIPDIFMADKRVVNLLHVAFGNGLSPVLLGNLVSLVNRSGWGLLNGFQFNGAWPRDEDLALLPGDAFPAGFRVVLQVRPLRSSFSFALADAVKQAREAGKIRRATDVLIDASGGRGEPIDLALADIYVRAFRQHASRLHVGIAGGLCAAEMPRVHDLVSRAGLSVDAEGALRDGDEGGTLNVERAKEYLKLAYQAQGHAS